MQGPLFHCWLKSSVVARDSLIFLYQKWLYLSLKDYSSNTYNHCLMRLWIICQIFFFCDNLFSLYLFQGSCIRFSELVTDLVPYVFIWMQVLLLKILHIRFRVLISEVQNFSSTSELGEMLTWSWISSSIFPSKYYPQCDVNYKCFKIFLLWGLSLTSVVQNCSCTCSFVDLILYNMQTTWLKTI